ncbi:MAG: hypothetical protein UX17_C0015G0003 [Parcubacteria group bacterium GW2011_GWC2_45_7]|nr:MAG: hypothetical protein UX17_C0015G0003 [Parcubacteria group bacterium GW2011_GWC2_45_7]KKU74125.1 MAG: hypothetical protein UX98_C0001G0055 [Parcubacteria group bacterium GW2011_GWA2_47_26]
MEGLFSMKDIINRFITIQARHGIFFRSEVTSELLIQNNNYVFKQIPKELFAKDPIFDEKNRIEKFYNRLKDGHHYCYGFFDQDNAVVFYMWISYPESTSILVPWVFKTKLVVKPCTAYIWDCFTAPQYRRRDLYKKGLLRAKALCAQQGVEQVYIDCTNDNIASQAGINSAGFKIFFAYTVRRVGALNFVNQDARKGVTVVLSGKGYNIVL